MPLNVAATSVKLAIPPPITRALFLPSGSAVAHCRKIMGFPYSQGEIKQGL